MNSQEVTALGMVSLTQPTSILSNLDSSFKTWSHLRLTAHHKSMSCPCKESILLAWKAQTSNTPDTHSSSSESPSDQTHNSLTLGRGASRDFSGVTLMRKLTSKSTQTNSSHAMRVSTHSEGAMSISQLPINPLQYNQVFLPHSDKLKVECNSRVLLNSSTGLLSSFEPSHTQFHGFTLATMSRSTQHAQLGSGCHSVVQGARQT